MFEVMLVFSLKKNRVLNSNLVREEINLNNGIQCKLSEENNLQIDNSSDLRLKCKSFESEEEALKFAKDIKTKLLLFGINNDANLINRTFNNQINPDSDYFKKSFGNYIFRDLREINVSKLEDEVKFVKINFELKHKLNDDMILLKKYLNLQLSEDKNRDWIPDIINNINQIYLVNNVNMKFVLAVSILEMITLRLFDKNELEFKEYQNINKILDHLKELQDFNPRFIEKVKTKLKESLEYSIANKIISIFKTHLNKDETEDDFKKTITKIYTIRSNIVHGNMDELDRDNLYEHTKYIENKLNKFVMSYYH